ncbi:MAG: hypothetical protein A2381_06480 [Bdellovibrionales bacterium RIFOXYB1_FULL_37_110]|nr:MAG: hypothetical protein A2181_08500 [Bdellovibrionales bacterium RIFOXYA1_FULL_38_20]OFZ50188.1 MAG: hypothetical protein A2417_19330 [Bdellovibrionales bacterium RIFOXYC1_FULL_37_79]OFZ53237.1 MAG: hypothetical protein A2328_06300 [Bdellovibrionales bacterium RIFOXYB2_FULL_36_6]OFZ57625.1 MAG: hypothetical protein A2381_06480 [Bdellovibrionales bacterium RIFOXYB1_FULL_37_110]OFZ61392.1 MAG: hypothetical protein A2577_00845 [Bdellovibrionales bacterium RIFOXYD1_FULL_36_51]
MIKVKLGLILLIGVLLSFSFRVQAADPVNTKNRSCRVKNEQDQGGNPYPKGYYKIRRGLKVKLISDSKAPLDTKISANADNPKIVYVEDAPTNDSYLIMKIYDDKHSPIAESYLVDCNHFYLSKADHEKENAFEYRKKMFAPIPYDFPSDMLPVAQTPEERLQVLGEINSKDDPSSNLPCCDGQDDGIISSQPIFSSSKSKDELDQYFACYRHNGQHHNDYLKTYRPALNKMSSMMYNILANETNDPGVNEQDIDAVLKCNLYKESFHWRGIASPTGAQGLGQFTGDGLSKVNKILSRIADYKEMDFEEMRQKLDEEFYNDHVKFNDERKAIESQIDKIEIELKTLPVNKENSKKIANFKTQIITLVQKITKLEAIMSEDYNKKVALLETDQISHSKVKKLKAMWDGFWEGHQAKKFKKPDLSKVVDWDSPNADLMTTKDFLGKNKNYAIAFLYSSMTIMDDYLDLDEIIKTHNAGKNAQIADQPSFLETLIGATGMYNMGPQGFKNRAMTSKNSTRFEDWIKNIKQSDLPNDRKSENVNHLVSNKRCAESGKNYQPCASEGGYTSNKEPKCNWTKMPEMPPNRSVCEKTKLPTPTPRCIDIKIRNYECTTK